MYISDDHNILSLYFEKFDGRTLLHEGHIVANLRNNMLPFFPYEYILFIMDLLIKTINYLKGNKLTHRDFSSTNILVNYQSREIKLIDFGLCTTLNSTTFSAVGTDKFVSPLIRNTVKHGLPITWGIEWDLY